MWYWYRMLTLCWHCITTLLQVVKQTVMTSVYGVTFVGARKQIQNVLEEKIIKGTGVSGGIYELSVDGSVVG